MYLAHIFRAPHFPGSEAVDYRVPGSEAVGNFFPHFAEGSGKIPYHLGSRNIRWLAKTIPDLGEVNASGDHSGVIG